MPLRSKHSTSGHDLSSMTALHSLEAAYTHSMLFCKVVLFEEEQKEENALQKSTYDRVELGYRRRSVLILAMVSRIVSTCEYLQYDQRKAELRQGCSYRRSVRTSNNTLRY